MYEKVRSWMKVGDLIAFSGKSRISNIIKWKTNTDISHVGMVYDTDETGEFRVDLIESTTLSELKDPYKAKFVKGVQRHKLSHLLNIYKGQAYWLPLKEVLSDGQKASMLSWLWTAWETETKYDTKGAIIAGLKILELMGLEGDADFSTLFCSELVANAYIKAGLLDADKINPSSETPADVVKYPFLGDRVQIK